MSDILRRASDAFHNRQRQDSTGSMDAPTSPDAAKPPVQEPMNQKPQSAQPDSHAKDPVATSANGVEHPKHRRHWGWGYHGKSPEAKQQPQSSQEQRDNDWIFGT
ncbi:hypothetical protein N7499_005580 [Penicillium canescens]|uniref:Uncharacterized protein n=1 Tax=Penicillium canescens TaxID=5083 RepID=A0AAD6N8U4_PENCN|nr:uncharacterized protein N7446_001347 [Penicillium canescens]KAJ5998040.1 hypothetical protein N7522_009700 [Penicillium canescens]KAJ6043151.1 hypothetical protein N7460_004506 [Penicillium canescens]KAJ6054626.1 hypothetical protein N7444_003724 [Penicillium canescens]KAJ6073570.1 hypothetical protein N7446_001347 [Penicillium canescens]KAJ6080706.1 hypothetical protein N7499_005580 [Penicillium canescens]